MNRPDQDDLYCDDEDDDDYVDEGVDVPLQIHCSRLASNVPCDNSCNCVRFSVQSMSFAICKNLEFGDPDDSPQCLWVEN